MSTTLEMIRAWLERAKANGATHLIVACDTFDWSDYPVEIHPSDDFYGRFDGLNGQNMQRVMEVYDLSLAIDDQLAERKAYHLPPRQEA